MPTMEELLQGRANRMVFKEVMCNYLLPSMVGKAEWKKTCHLKRPDQLATSVTQEAWALLCVENSIEKWNAIEEEVRTNDKVLMSTEGSTDLPETKYTLSKNKAKKHHGWKVKGLQRFTNLCRMVQKDREKHGTEVDQEYMEMKEEELYKKRNYKRNHAGCSDVTTHMEEDVYDDMPILLERVFGSGSSESSSGAEHSSSGTTDNDEAAKRVEKGRDSGEVVSV
jgi:hypothetical protein